ncbi:hypothetical protein M8998_06420 [Sphingobacterium sp. lm-10]|uniref:hypothetical protein n=1 Tax=Sphingobacterium sp. lm-10 TaxID=2944904 RepID=UPI002020AEF0|nr:hypothetical protein [Sphingobacterium sp. lm-10]MCL7987568.1 hypothetical protein [Sphingobacterium sp. lm-10]
METRISRLLTLVGLWMITILSVSGQTAPDRLRTITPARLQSELISASSTNGAVTPASRHHLFSTSSSSHHALDQALEQIEEISVKKDESAPQPDRLAQQGFHPRWYYSNPTAAITCLPSYTKHIANQLAVRTERYILFQDFRI